MSTSGADSSRARMRDDVHAICLMRMRTMIGTRYAMYMYRMRSGTPRIRNMNPLESEVMRMRIGLLPLGTKELQIKRTQNYYPVYPRLWTILYYIMIMIKCVLCHSDDETLSP